MTKEEALELEYRKWVDEKGISAIYTPTFPAAYKDAALNALASYAKQQSIAFMKWLDILHSQLMRDHEYEESYGQFLEHQKQNNK